MAGVVGRLVTYTADFQVCITTATENALFERAESQAPALRSITCIEQSYSATTTGNTGGAEVTLVVRR